MPEKENNREGPKDAARQSPFHEAGEFVREEIEHVRRESMELARPSRPSPLVSRKLGVWSEIATAKKARSRNKARTQAANNYAQGQRLPGRKASPTVSRAITAALKREA